jgi:signal recognition particle receptor subunit beta
LPVTTKTASSKYRSANDPTLQIHKRFLLIDTPGHGKLRYHALDCIHKTQNLKGIIFVVDAANLSSGSSGLRDAAEYLYNILLLLQNASSTSKVSKMQRDLPVLIAANKLDLFTSLPAPLVKSALESEITTIRSSRGKGLLDSTVGTNSLHLDQEKDFLGQDGQDKFEFSQMEDINVTVAIAGGSVIGGETYWDWIGQYL